MQVAFLATSTELFHKRRYCYLAIFFMERRVKAGSGGTALYSRSVPTGQVSAPCILLRRLRFLPPMFLPIVMDTLRQATWFYRVALFMGPPHMAAFGATARYSRSTQMAQILGPCIASAHP